MTFIRQREETGTGQPIIALITADTADSCITYISREPIPGYRVIVLEVDIASSNCDAVAAEVMRFLDAVAIKQVSLLGIGNAGPVSLSLALAHRKRIRRLILIDSPVRPDITKREKIMSWLEYSLPLGLPFRRVGKGFDGRSYLQRIRCPSLVVTTLGATQDVKSQAEIAGKSLATAWYYELTSNQEFKEKLKDFLDVPAKRPQKSIRKASIIGSN